MIRKDSAAFGGRGLPHKALSRFLASFVLLAGLTFNHILWAQDVEIEDPEIQAIANDTKTVAADGKEISPEELEAYRKQVQSMMLSSNPEAAPIDGMGQFLSQSAKTLQSMNKADLRKHLGGGKLKAKLVFTEHHESHGASAFYPSPFEEAAVLTVDGVGEWATASIGVGKGNRFRLLHWRRYLHTL